MTNSFRILGTGRKYAILAGILLATTVVAQRNCGSMEYLQQQIAADPDRGENLQSIDDHTTQFVQQFDPSAERAVVMIPVVFHVVYRTAAENISDAKIQAQLAQLNADYARLNSDAGNTPSAFASLGANTEIQFCLAQRDPNGNATTGIVRRSTTVTSFSDNDAVKFTANGGSNAWPSASYLNFWSANLSGGLLGYAQFPGGAASTDGVVCLYSSIGSINSPGTASPYDLGRTATHEVGHWLNLRHIWGDANCGNDLVSDTPTQQTDNGGCPSFPHVTCSNGPNGDMFMNYMDYTNDNCMNLFTQGQKSRMQALFGTGGSRVGLLSSLGCVAPGATCAVPTGLGSSNITSSTATISWGAASGAVSYDLQYKTSAASTWTTVNTTGTSQALTGLIAGTSYNAQVRTVCSSTASAYSGTITFSTTVSGCADALEPNNSTGAPADIALPASINALIANSTDADYYRFTLSATSNLSITLGNLAADYDLRLLNSAGTQLAISEAGGTTSESITYNNAAPGTYFIHAFGYGGVFSATQCYALSASGTVVVTCNAPTGLAASAITSSGATLAWAAATGATSYNLQYKTAASGTWTTVPNSTTSRTLTGLTASTSYNAQVQTVCPGGTSSYSTAINFTTGSAACTDPWESNNTSGTAKSIAVNTNINGLISSTTDIDWFKFTNTSAASKIRIDLSNLPADYDVVLYRGTSTQVGIGQVGGTTSEVIILNTTTIATYYIKVYGYSGANNSTQCYTLRASTSGSNFREGMVTAEAEEVALEPVEGLMNLYPNPANDKVMLDYVTTTDGPVRIQLFDAMGRQVLGVQEIVTPGPTTFGLPLPTLSNGMYTLLIADGDRSHQRRIMISQ